MTSRTKKIIEDFEQENRRLWGDKFFIITQGNKLTLMTEGLVKKLKDLVGTTDDVVITSLDKDESIGEWYRVKRELTTHIHHYHREPKETRRILQDLPSKEMVTIKDEDGQTVTKNELMGGELFRGKRIGNWVAAAVYHDFVDIAPKVIGWVKLDDRIEQITEKEFVRPEKLAPLDEVVSKLVGLPYHFGGKSFKTGFDCSSMVQWIMFHTKGIWLPKLSAWQIFVGEEVSQKNVQIGDLVFFHRRPEKAVGHVGLVYKFDNGEIDLLHAFAGERSIVIEKLDAILARQGEDGLEINSIRRIKKQ